MVKSLSFRRVNTCRNTFLPSLPWENIIPRILSLGCFILNILYETDFYELFYMKITLRLPDLSCNSCIELIIVT